MRRKVLGQYVRSFASVKTMAFAHAREAVEGVAPFLELERMMSTRVSELQARQEEHFSEDAFAAAIIDIDELPA